MNKEINSPKLPTDVDSLQRRIARLKRLAKKYKRAEIVQNALLGISNIANDVNSLDDFYTGVHQHLQRLIPADNFFIAAQNPKTGLISLPFFADEKDAHPSELFPDEEISQILNRGITGYVLRQGLPLLCNEDEFRLLIAQGKIQGLGSPCHQWLGVPIKNGEVVNGVLVVQSYNTEISYGELELELMGFISQHISGVMERLLHNEQLEVAIEERTRELSQAYNSLKSEVKERIKAENLQKSLFQIADLSSSKLAQKDFYNHIHQIISQLLPAENCFISLIDNNMLSFPFYVSQMDNDYPSTRPVQDGLTEYILQHKQPRLLSNIDIKKLVELGDIYAKSPELNRTEHMHQWIGVPLIINDHVVGALTIYSLDSKQNYQIKDLELLTFVSQHIANAIERKHAVESLKRSHELLEEKVATRTQALAQVNRNLQTEINQRRKIEAQLVHDAQHDGLTGLPNRNFLMDRLSQALKHVRRHGLDQFALLFIDLDRFKVINDTFGHLEGDRFLIETAKRLKSCIRENDTLARMGGDEFVILLDSIHGTQDAIEVSERILHQVGQAYSLSNKDFVSGASIGIAFSRTDKLETSESILRDADRAMYQAKSNGKGCYVIFDSDLSYQSEQRNDLDEQLTLALSQNLIKVSYRPIYDLVHQTVVAIEPQAQWQHETHGVWDHNKLLQLTTNAQLSLIFDDYIFQQLNKDYPVLKQQYGAVTQLYMSISSQHVNHKYALRGLKNTLKSSKIDLSKLTVFFNEKSLVKDTENHLNAFEIIKKLGSNIGIDHFGTGYSSLSSLSFLPISTLMLDQEISKHLLNDNQLKLVKAYRLAAEALDINMIATGIDTLQQKLQFIEMGYQLATGRTLEKKNENRVNIINYCA
ncbi:MULTISPECIES: sensor domain-containing phosphodiesterase [Pseudomonadati]|uniref:Diguanylate cyclase n=1 Tax=Shewanella aestuarii TaxID=1028752 RepID=A0ABT0L3X9_9GAMM|nr:diguanylate cyclase [Shewanella aestuarii]MCL1118394.1 diguanylate cyclase [Shewanella aestuarii]